MVVVTDLRDSKVRKMRKEAYDIPFPTEARMESMGRGWRASGREV